MMRVLESIVDSARNFLVTAQDADGFWREYLLPPGMSTAWTTACVAFALGPGNVASDRARQALLSELRSSGWGYNASVATDADSTAWALRVMAAANHPCARNATGFLAPFIGAAGGVRTFRDPHPFGTWAQEHADVTAVVGLALVECGGDRDYIERIRDWCLRVQCENGSWRSFWWATDIYATAKMIEFLVASGVKSQAVFNRAAEWILVQQSDSSAFEAAHALMALAHSGLADHKKAHGLIDLLYDAQQPDGSWPPSKILLVPAQHRDDAHSAAFEDCRRVMTTAACLQALGAYA